MKELVSIIVPVYNGENYVVRFFDSILAQSYRPLELIIINDGSTDRTDEIITEYLEIFKKSKVTPIYLQQGNQGTASSVNRGLKLFTGKYLIWIDGDDFLFPESIEKRVRFLEDNPQYGFVMSNGYSYNEEDISVPVCKAYEDSKKATALAENFFENLIVRDKIKVLNLSFMYRSSAFIEANPERDIDISRQGQNIQMLLPMAFSHKCGYMDECLYGRVIRKDSHFHSIDFSDLSQYSVRMTGINNIFINTLQKMPEEAELYIPYMGFKTIVQKFRKSLVKENLTKARGYYMSGIKFIKLFLGLFKIFIACVMLYYIKKIKAGKAKWHI